MGKEKNSIQISNWFFLHSSAAEWSAKKRWKVRTEEWEKLKN